MDEETETKRKQQTQRRKGGVSAKERKVKKEPYTHKLKFCEDSCRGDGKL